MSYQKKDFPFATYSLYILLTGGAYAFLSASMCAPFLPAIWAASPYAFFGLVAFGVHRIFNNRKADMAFFACSLLITGFGLFVFIKVLVLSPMESNLGLIFGPIHQYELSFLLLTAWFLVLAVIKLIGRFIKTGGAIAKSPEDTH